MKIKEVLVVYVKHNIKKQIQTLDTIRKSLKKYNIKNKFVDRLKLKKNHFKNVDFIITVGGDGTFLKAAHFVLDKKLFLGVNSDPQSREGFFLNSTKKAFGSKFKKILNKKYKIRKIHRLEAFINNKKVKEFALNEFYIASEKPYLTARYYIKVRGKKEIQKSSGILISTAAGSNAWMKSAGGKILPLGSDKFQYLVREPYCGRVSAKCNLLNGILNKKEKIEIVFEIGNGILIADSLSREYKIKSGQKVIVKISRNPLYAVSFK